MKYVMCAALLLLMGCQCDGRTYMEQQADECKAKGGEPMQTYAVYANGLVMGCYYKDAE